MNLQTSQPDKTRIITLSVLSGIGITVLSLLISILLDYIVVQVLSQFFLADCSEDCYFAYFNAIFYIVALLSLVVGFVGGRRTYRRLVERSK
jgi:hypothetical protein